MKPKLIEKILRIGVFLTFIGHGIFAIKGNESWLVYLTTLGITIDTSKHLIVAIGVFDVIIAISILIKPFKYVVLWACIWAFATALIRPVSGESFFAFIEKGSNWAAPLALYLILMNNNTSKKIT